MYYKYPIEIFRGKKSVDYTDSYELEDYILTLEKLRLYVNEKDTFEIHPTFSSGAILIVYKTRLETDQEQMDRIQREEDYMKKYYEVKARRDKGERIL